MALTEDLLTRIRERANRYDRNNEYFAGDLDELKAADYFTLFVPKENGGAGLTLPEMVEVQMQLAGASAATALSVNMHHIWMGVARQASHIRPSSPNCILEQPLAG